VRRTLTKSQLVDALARDHGLLEHRDVREAVDAILDACASALAEGRRTEIRGFGAFVLHRRSSRRGRNPKTGAPIQVPAKVVPRFKPGKMLVQRVQQRDT
jgi:integration host factor subunit beta